MNKVWYAFEIGVVSKFYNLRTKRDTVPEFFMSEFWQLLLLVVKPITIIIRSFHRNYHYTKVYNAMEEEVPIEGPLVAYI
jgi:hypothetical protein